MIYVIVREARVVGRVGVKKYVRRGRKKFNTTAPEMETINN